MIGGVSIIVLALMFNDISLFLLLIPYILSFKRKDLSLITYWVILLYIESRFHVPSICSYTELIRSYVVSLTIILTLEECLRGAVISKFSIMTSLFLVLGIVIPELFIIGALFYMLIEIKFNIKLFGLILLIPTALFVICKVATNEIGATYVQLNILTSATIFILALLMSNEDGNIKKVKMFF